MLSGSGSKETACCWWMVFFDGSQQVLRLFDEYEDLQVLLLEIINTYAAGPDSHAFKGMPIFHNMQQLNTYFKCVLPPAVLTSSCSNGSFSTAVLLP